MKIIIVGYGKIGHTIAKVLSDKKGIHVTVVDSNPDIFNDPVEMIDAILIAGNGANERTLIEAGARDADLIVCTTNADELNVLCCIMAERLGTKHSIARVRNPDYTLEYNKLWKELGIDMIINPERQTAREISRLLRYPAFNCIDTFVGGRVELVSYKVSEAPEFFVGKSVSEVFHKKMGVLLAVVERENKAFIPNGDFVFEEPDTVRILGRPSDVMSFFTHVRKKPKAQEIMVVGGGKITYYLAELLNRHAAKSNIKIIEKDRRKCEIMSEMISGINHRCMFICGDGTNEELLLAEEIEKADAVICLTDRDEENAIISLYALRTGVNKIITKINHLQQSMIKSLGLSFGNIITPQNIIADIVSRYVNGLDGVIGTNIITMHEIFSGEDGDVQAIEFHVNQRAKYLDVPIRNLRLKKGVLIGCIVRNFGIIIPSGDTQIQTGDSVIIIAKNTDIHELDDIMASRLDVLLK